jgi:ubiquitin related modifier 1
MELLFDNQRSIDVDIPMTAAIGSDMTVRDAMIWMRDHLLKERPEMFMKDDTMYAVSWLNACCTSTNI